MLAAWQLDGSHAAASLYLNFTATFEFNGTWRKYSVFNTLGAGNLLKSLVLITIEN